MLERRRTFFIHAVFDPVVDIVNLRIKPTLSGEDAQRYVQISLIGFKRGCEFSDIHRFVLEQIIQHSFLQERVRRRCRHYSIQMAEYRRAEVRFVQLG